MPRRGLFYNIRNPRLNLWHLPFNNFKVNYFCSLAKLFPCPFSACLRADLNVILKIVMSKDFGERYILWKKFQNPPNLQQVFFLKFVMFPMIKSLLFSDPTFYKWGRKIMICDAFFSKFCQISTISTF